MKFSVLSMCELFLFVNSMSYNSIMLPHLILKSGSIKLLDSKQLWRESRTLSNVCDGICVHKSDIAHMRGMGGLDLIHKTHKGEDWSCIKVCPEMKPIVRNMRVISLGNQNSQCCFCP